jgi:nucleotide-binding universal stress UspA family protein
LIRVNSAREHRTALARRPTERTMKILIAVDGSDYTKRMLAYIAAHEEWFGIEHNYTVIHAVLAVPHRAAAFVGQNVVREYYESDAELVFKPIRAFFAQKGLKPTFVHTVGHVADSIAELAEEGKFDLVVLGSHGQGNVVNMVLGSVATKVLAKCTVPALLIR